MSHLHRIHRVAAHHHQKAAASLHVTHKHAKRLLKKHKVVLHKIRHHATRSAAVATVSAGVLAGPVLAANTETVPEIPAVGNSIQRELIKDHAQRHVSFADVAMPANTEVFGPSNEGAQVAEEKLAPFPEELRKLVSGGIKRFSPQQEREVAELVQKQYKVPASFVMDEVRLNVSQGLVGGEQHLPLYPGDTLANHSSDPTSHLTGMVPGLPSWGYFAPNKQSVTKKMIESERYYFVAQTFLTDGWEHNFESLYKWFKGRKIIAINTQTGQGIVGEIWDAGPGRRTGKQFGASNENMDALGFGLSRKGEVIVMFVDDPNDTIPLGPISPK